MKKHRTVWWLTDSGTIMLLTFGGICVFTPLNHGESSPLWISGIVLLVVLWLSFVTFLTSLLCWIASKIFH